MFTVDFHILFSLSYNILILFPNFINLGTSVIIIDPVDRKRNTSMEKMATNKYLSIITLNVNRLNALIKRHRVAEWISKHDPSICCLQETNHRMKHTDYKKMIAK